LKRKSQAALEFLVTYSWALLAILIALGALYYFGIFNFGKFLPERCLFTSQLECTVFSFQPDEVRIKLTNNIGETLTIEDITINNNDDPPLACTTTPTSSGPMSGWEAGTELDLVFSGCSGGGYISGERTEAKVTVTYYAEDTPTQPRHTITGKLQGGVV
jgi:hypothetical protein